MEGETNPSGKGLWDMAEYTLHEQAERFLGGELTFKQLHKCMDEVVIQDFRSGIDDPDTSKLAYSLVGIFAEYQLDCEILGDPSEAMKAFRRSLLEFIQENFDSMPTEMAVEHAPR